MRSSACVADAERDPKLHPVAGKRLKDMLGLRREHGPLVRADADRAEAEARGADAARHPDRQPAAARRRRSRDRAMRASMRRVRELVASGAVRPTPRHRRPRRARRSALSRADARGGLGRRCRPRSAAASASASPTARPRVYAGEVLETWMSRAGWSRAGRAPDRRAAAADAQRARAERRDGHRGQREPRPDLDQALRRAAAAFRRWSIPASASPARPGLKNMSAAASA